MSRSVGVFSDLDRTLVYSRSALGLAARGEELPPLLCVERIDGDEAGWVSQAAVPGLTALTEAGVLVPVTTRTPAQYRRITLPGAVPKFALCANGGRLLRDGEEDLDYTTALAARLAGEAAPFEEVYARLRGMVDGPEGAAADGFVLRAAEAESLFCYAVVDRAAMPDAWLAELTGFCAERGWAVSVQGRKVYCVPVGLSKGTAIREVALMLGVDRVLAAGDSLLDIPLLEVADAAIRPAHGELEDTAYAAPGVAVTRSRGVRAGEEIVAWMVERALRAL